MTTYQEPLQSRRAARQRERADEAAIRDARQGQAVSGASVPGMSVPGVSVTDAFSPSAPFPAAVPPQRPSASAQPAQTTGPQFASPYPVPQPGTWAQPPSAPTGPAPLAPAPRIVDDGPPQQSRGRRAATPSGSVASNPVASLPEDALRTRSRRELRELREQTGITSEPLFGITRPEAPQPTGSALTGAQPGVPMAAAAADSIPAPFPESAAQQSATRRGRRAAAAPVDAANASVIEAELVVEPTPHASAPYASGPQPVVLEAVSQPVPMAPPAPSGPQQFVSAPVPMPVPEAPQQAAPIVDPDAGVPVGHWSTQGDIDERVQTHGIPTSRTVGASGAEAVTSTLVLRPQEDPLLGAMSRTGEIMLTGSIQLPASLSSTGALLEHLEHPSLDHAYDTEDRGGNAPDSAPVRALAAVSTQTSAHGIIQAQQASNRSFTILIAAAATMAVLVGALVVVGLATGLF